MFQLAWAVGYPHPRPMLEDITAVEYGELLEALTSLPHPERRADVRAAMVALVTARAAGAKGVKLVDFLPDYDAAPTEAQTPEQMDAAMRIIAAQFAANTKHATEGE